MYNFIKQFKRNSYPQVPGHLLLQNFDKFAAYDSSICKKIESKVLFKKEFCK